MNTQYKCRMCGEIFEPSCTDRLTMLKYLSALTCRETCYIDEADGHGMSRYTLHFHKDGSIGFADLIGAVPEKGKYKCV